MDVVLQVLQGAKAGGKIKIKKEQFLIGRSRECSLCAGTTSISRRHCVILRDNTRVSVKDLGSRNGTLVNGVKIDQIVQLQSGDELTLGPLRFLVLINHGISNLKRSKVKSVADAAQRTASASASDIHEEDISSWLSGPPSSPSLTETRTIRLDNTNASDIKKALKEHTPSESVSHPPHEGDGSSSDSYSGSDRLPGKKGANPASNSEQDNHTGKLPRIPSKPATKDSREAAAEALRSWGRR